MDDGDFRTLPAPMLPNREHPWVLAGTGPVIKRFNRNTMLLATGLLGTVIFAALVLAAQERYQKAPVFTDEVCQPGAEISLNANPLVLSRVMGFDAGKGGEIPSGPTTNADEGISPQPKEVTQLGGCSPAHRQDSRRVIRPKNPSVRVPPSLWAKIADVLTFWHRKPVPTERSRGWVQFSKKGKRKRVSLTAEANH